MNVRASSVLVLLTVALGVVAACTVGNGTQVATPMGTNFDGCNPTLLPPGSCGPCCQIDSCQDCCEPDASCPENCFAGACSSGGVLGNLAVCPTDAGTIPVLGSGGMYECQSCASLIGTASAVAISAFEWCPSGYCGEGFADQVTSGACCVPGASIDDAGPEPRLCTAPTRVDAAPWSCADGCMLVQSAAAPNSAWCCAANVQPLFNATSDASTFDGGVDAPTDSPSDRPQESGE
jgi:hypothetical protein